MNVIYQCLFSWCIGVSFGYRVFPAQILRINYQWGLGNPVGQHPAQIRAVDLGK